ncbi:uncharacterized protein [Paramisgurnus dabryanus]|uniref:uncharacterized protein n=1 Tax=Paramisgurnus dabryanus TaxID=90735 RepID=UPI0031F4746E
MAGALQYICLLLTFGIPIHECTAVYEDAKCVTDPPCFDLNIVAKMARQVSEDLIAADGESILLKHNLFDKIRKKKDLHSCVLLKILDLFENVLVRTEEKSPVHPKGEINPHTELIHIMDRLETCVYKNKKGCDRLYSKAINTAPMRSSKLEPIQAAILQLQKLNNASESLDDVNIQKRAMDELKSLHLYIRGKGFRKKLSD